MATCFPSKAPRAWGIFHLLSNWCAISSQPSGVRGQESTSSLYSSAIAAQTSGIRWQMVSDAVLKSYAREVYVSPHAMYLIVIANLRPAGRALLNLVSCFWILGATRWRISSNISGVILMYLLKEITSSFLSSCMSVSYWPYWSLLSTVSHGLTHHLWRLLLLLLRASNRTSWPSLSAWICNNKLSWIAAGATSMVACDRMRTSWNRLRIYNLW